MTTTRTVTNESGSAAVAESLLWTINDVSSIAGPVVINFSNAVTEIPISGNPSTTDRANTISCNNLTINGQRPDGVRVRIRNVNSQPNALALFSVSGLFNNLKTAFHLENLEVYSDPSARPQVPCKLFDIKYVSKVSVRNCYLHDNAAGTATASHKSGGAINFVGCPDVSFNSSILNNNTAGGGGAITLGNSRARILKSEFVGNVSGSNGGAIQATGAVDITDSVFRNNQASSPSSGSGGGVYVAGAGVESRITGCVFEGNIAVSQGGGLHVGGNAPTVITRSSFESNKASMGGGVSAFSASITIELSTFAENTSTSSIASPLKQGGGALYAYRTPITVTSSLFTGNRAVDGAGLAYFSDFPFESSLFNNTFYGNTASGTGGGLVIASVIRKVHMTNCTIAKNTAGTNGGGIWIASGSFIEVGNNLIALNSAPTSGPDVYGAVMSYGTNLVGVANLTHGFIGSDITGTPTSPLDPEIGPLSNNGGFTLTSALLPSSPAIDAGNPALIPLSNPLAAFDQRGQSPFFRTSNGRPDVGAFELQ
ncbi:Hypothetical protein MVR_LOCUS297 [uncultured virus]|nr:Hypothetical protein MVR_LOCUS297 [uncultured virus]